MAASSQSPVADAPTTAIVISRLMSGERVAQAARSALLRDRQPTDQHRHREEHRRQRAAERRAAPQDRRPASARPPSAPARCRAAPAAAAPPATRRSPAPRPSRPRSLARARAGRSRRVGSCVRSYSTVMRAAPKLTSARSTPGSRPTPRSERAGAIGAVHALDGEGVVHEARADQRRLARDDSLQFSLDRRSGSKSYSRPGGSRRGSALSTPGSARTCSATRLEAAQAALRTSPARSGSGSTPRVTTLIGPPARRVRRGPSPAGRARRHARHRARRESGGPRAASAPAPTRASTRNWCEAAASLSPNAPAMSPTHSSLAASAATETRRRRSRVPERGKERGHAWVAPALGNAARAARTRAISTTAPVSSAACSCSERLGRGMLLRLSINA